MRVLYCTDTYPPQVNGVSIVTALSVERSRAARMGCAVVAPRYPADADDARRGRISVRSSARGSPACPCRAIPRSAGSPPRAERSRAHQRSGRTWCTARPSSASAGRGKRPRGARAFPLVSSYHTDFARYAEAYGAPLAQARWCRLSSGASIARAGGCTPPRCAPRTDLLSARRRPDVEVWGRGVDTELFHPGPPEPSAARSPRAWGADSPSCTSGGSRRRSGSSRSCWRRSGMASDEVPRGVIHLVIAGTGPREAELRAAAPPGVSFLGLLDRADAAARSLRQLRRVRVRVGDRDARPGRAGGDGERPAGHRGARGRGRVTICATA